MLIDIPWKTALLLVPLLVAGCAPAYHDYPRGCVRYGYCPPPPLPHIWYPPLMHSAESDCRKISEDADHREERFFPEHRNQG
jgi:hypothetical protein